MSDRPDTEAMDAIVCPYCGNTFDPDEGWYYEMDEDEFEHGSFQKCFVTNRCKECDRPEWQKADGLMPGQIWRFNDEVKYYEMQGYEFFVVLSTGAKNGLWRVALYPRYSSALGGAPVSDYSADELMCNAKHVGNIEVGVMV